MAVASLREDYMKYLALCLLICVPISGFFILMAHDCSGQTLGLGMAIGLAVGRMISLLMETKTS